MKLKVEPYEYQKDGIKQGLAWKRLFIGDEPGLGKTLQSIGITNEAGAFPCLVVCPSSLKINWQREWEKFTDRKAFVLTDQTRATWGYYLQSGMFDVAICNYESLRKFFVLDIKQKGAFKLKDVVFNTAIRLFRSIIIDESHRVKDPTAQQTIFVKGLSMGKEYIMLLSGTPVVNKASDLIAQLSIMERLQEFGGRGKFLADYELDGKPNLEELQKKLRETCLIRREKAKVLTQLPDKTRVDLVVSISNREEYDAAQRDLRKYLQEYTECTDQEIRRKMRMEALVRFMTLRGLSAKGKVAQAAEFIENFIQSGKKIVVFCSLHEIVDELCGRFPTAVRVTGRDSMKDKQDAVDAFQTDQNVQIIVCSIKAAGVGLTLTASSTVCFIEFPWTFSDCAQCEDRTHRIGQKDNVTCYYLIGEHTIDGVLYRIIQNKKALAYSIMGGEDTIPTDKQYFDELINQFETND